MTLPWMQRKMAATVIVLMELYILIAVVIAFVRFHVSPSTSPPFKTAT